jgi:hypothetical protein
MAVNAAGNAKRLGLQQLEACLCVPLPSLRSIQVDSCLLI